MAVPANPGWKFGYVPSPGEWNNTFAGKVDYPAPIDQGGTGGQDAAAGNYNLQQRVQVITPTASLNPLTVYGLRTDLTAMTLALPLASACKPGDWIDLLDCGANASVNHITINAAGADEIYLFATGASTQQINVDNGGAILVCIGNAWRMWSQSSPAPAVISLDGTESWNAYKDGVPVAITPTLIAAFAGNITQYIQWAIWFNATPQSLELLALYTAASAFTLPSNFDGSQAVAPIVNPASSFVLTVHHIVSGSSSMAGTITIGIDGAVTFATTAGAVIPVGIGDQLSITGPNPADTDISGFSATLKGILA